MADTWPDNILKCFYSRVVIACVESFGRKIAFLNMKRLNRVDTEDAIELPALHARKM